MKLINVLALSLSTLTTSMAFAEVTSVTFKGLSGSNAALLTESLIEEAANDNSITLDRSIYTITKVTRSDDRSTIVCRRDHFGATPPQYECTITSQL